MNRMKYRGYSAVVDYDDNDHIFVGHISGIRDIVGFHGRTVDRYLDVADIIGPTDGETSRHFVLTDESSPRSPEFWRWLTSFPYRGPSLPGSACDRDSIYDDRGIE